MTEENKKLVIPVMIELATKGDKPDQVIRLEVDKIGYGFGRDFFGGSVTLNFYNVAGKRISQVTIPEDLLDSDVVHAIYQLVTNKKSL